MRHVADERDRAQRIFDRQIQHHAHQSDPGDASLPCGEDNKDGGKGSKRIANAGYPPDDSVETEANPRSGYDEAIVEPSGDYVELFVRRKRGFGRPYGFNVPGKWGKNFSVDVWL